MKDLDYEALLKLSRAEADQEIQRRYGNVDSLFVHDKRRQLVVKRFLERICPIKVQEAL